MTGASYGGAIALLTAAYDERVDAIAPEITYWNLADALFPNGVFKKLWAGIFINAGGGCDNFETQLCEMYNRVAESGTAGRGGHRSSSRSAAPPPSATASRCPRSSCRARPTPSSRSARPTPMAKAIRANGAPVDVDWIAGGHDGGDMEADRVQARVGSWFDRYLKDEKGVDTGPAFRVTRTGGIDSTDGAALLRGASGDTYPGLESGEHAVALTGREQSVDNPAGASPPAISALPGTRRRGRPVPALLPRRRRVPRLPRPVRPLRVGAPGQRPADHRIADGDGARQVDAATTRSSSRRCTTSAPAAASRCCPPSW